MLFAKTQGFDEPLLEEISYEEKKRSHQGNQQKRIPPPGVK